jgi:Asp-tRNA(Asn)/Glu-tRNA(Gln) amidotransferase A subunit family amidase
MVMKQFADVVSKFDVYLAPATGGSIRRGGRGATTADGPPPATPPAPQPPSPTRDHFAIANVCGYPALAVPNGFTVAGTPTSITFLGRLYNEAAILALAKAYQDRARWHTRTPALANPTPTAG